MYPSNQLFDNKKHSLISTVSVNRCRKYRPRHRSLSQTQYDANKNSKQQKEISLTNSTKDQFQLNKLDIKSNKISNQRMQIKDVNRKNKKKFCSLYKILILIIAILLCGLLAATLVFSLKKATTVILTAATVTTTTTQGIIRTTSTIFTTTTTTGSSLITVFWSFDNNTNDMYNNYNGVALNSPNYVTGYTGLNSKALNMNKSLSQFVIVTTPYFNFTHRSFTVELWFYPTLLTSGDYGLFGQCQSTSPNLCLIYMLRNYHLLLAFYNDDLTGTTAITENKWYHAAFVYDYATSMQTLYLNGLLQGNRTAGLYQGQTGSITIGSINNPSDYVFNGYVDQVSLVTRAKTASEVLYDATVVCYYPFDFNSFYDSGSLGLNGTAIGLSFVSGMGRVKDCISFTATNSYFLSGGMTLLGTTGESYSLAVWIKPTSVTNGMITYVSKCDYNCASNWCMPFIGFTSTGQIAIQSWSAINNGTIVILTGPNIAINTWIHVVQTYSSINGMRLYLNGLLYSTSSTFIYLASNSPNYIYLGSFPLMTCDATSSVISAEQFYGFLDEFYLFSRELSAADVSSLANP